MVSYTNLSKSPTRWWSYKDLEVSPRSLGLHGFFHCSTVHLIFLFDASKSLPWSCQPTPQVAGRSGSQVSQVRWENFHGFERCLEREDEEKGSIIFLWRASFIDLNRVSSISGVIVTFLKRHQCPMAGSSWLPCWLLAEKAGRMFRRNLLRHDVHVELVI